MSNDLAYAALPDRAHNTTIWLAMQQAETGYIDAGGVLTRYARAGTGPPLILLHGTGGHLEAFAHNVVSLSRTFTVIAIDMVGHGFSARPPIDYVLTDYTAHLLDVLDALGIEKAHVGGQSLGGWVATWFALEHPTRVMKVVNCTGGGQRWPEGEYPEDAESRREGVEIAKRIANAVTPETILQRIAHLIYRKETITRELVDCRLAIYRQPGWQPHFEKVQQMFPYDSPLRVKYSFTEEMLASMSHPVFYLWTDHNPSCGVRSAERAHRATPGSTFAVMENCAHWPQWENPSEFNELVENFLLG